MRRGGYPRTAFRQQRRRLGLSNRIVQTEQGEREGSECRQCYVPVVDGLATDTSRDRLQALHAGAAGGRRCLQRRAGDACWREHMARLLTGCF